MIDGHNRALFGFFGVGGWGDTLDSSTLYPDVDNCDFSGDGFGDAAANAVRGWGGSAAAEAEIASTAGHMLYPSRASEKVPFAGYRLPCERATEYGAAAQARQ